MKFDFIIVGAGFAGCVLAERITSQVDQKVLIIEQRNHIGGNTFDYYDENSILTQKYGPHILHTNDSRVWEYLSQFTEWNGYVHRVLANVNDIDIPLPINLETMEALHSRSYTSEELENYFNDNKIDITKPQNSRDVILSQVGEELYDLFFKNYTKKQWGVYPEQLSAQVTKRLPVRLNRDSRYFADKHQGLPRNGFTCMFDKMLDNENIHILLNTNYKDVLDSIEFEKLIFTGPIDDYFDCKFGKLPYRSLDFKFETHDLVQYQNAGVVNYPNDHDYTRITEFKYLYEQSNPKTRICFEYPKDEGDPYYPIPRAENEILYKKYKDEAEKLENTYFIGRLAQYKYMNMDQVVAIALDVFDKKIKIGL